MGIKIQSCKIGGLLNPPGIRAGGSNGQTGRQNRAFRLIQKPALNGKTNKAKTCPKGQARYRWQGGIAPPALGLIDPA
jgi:hypothetical protein